MFFKINFPLVIVGYQLIDLSLMYVEWDVKHDCSACSVHYLVL